MRYHINPDTQKISPCDASERSCPYGEINHFATREEAQDALGESYPTPEPLRKDPKLRQEALDLIKELHDAAEAYYQKGEDSPLTDEEFDAKLGYLETLSQRPELSELFKEGTPGWLLLENDPDLGTKPAEETVEHLVPMVSLQKAKKEPELYSYLKKMRQAGAKGFKLQAKMDGLAMSVLYKEGKATQLSTRGGEDSTYLLKEPKLKIEGLPLTVTEKEPLELRGEIFFTESQFKAADAARFAATGQHFANPRNAVSGLLKAAKLGLDFPVEFTFTTYGAFKGTQPQELSSLKEPILPIDAWSAQATGGLQLTDLKSDKEVMEAVHHFGKLRENFSFPTDGVVIKPTNEAELLEKTGFTSHHPVSQIAWKYPAETAATTVEAITMTVGRSGRVTPVARVTPVNLGGSTVSAASLHNFNLVATKGIRVGSQVLVEKANEIIPQVKAVLSNPPGTKEYPLPNKCPYCGTLLSFDKGGEWPPKTLRCPNGDCDSRSFAGMTVAVGKTCLDIDGLSTATLEYLNSTGRVKNLADLYTLTQEELQEAEFGEGVRLGEKRAAHIMAQLEASKKRPLNRVLQALNIELLGATAAKDLQKRYGTIEKIMEASEQEIASMEGYGEIKARKIYAGLQSRRKLIEQLKEKGVLFGTGETTTPLKDSPLKGKSFSISGAVPPGFDNRAAWVEYLEAQGATFHSSPRADTTYIIGNPSEGSSKIKKAIQLGLSFLSPQEFTKEFVPGH